MNIFVLLSLISAIVSLFSGNFIYLRNPKNKLNTIFLFFCITVAYIAFTEYEYRHSTDYDTAFLWFKVSSFWPFAISFILHFSLTLTKKWKENKSLYILIYLPALIFSILQSTTDLIIKEMIKEYWGWTYISIINPFVISMVLWSSSAGIISVYLCFRHYLKTENFVEKQQSKYITIGILFPIILSIISQGLLGNIGIKIPELASIGFLVGIVFIAYGMWKYELFAVKPVDAVMNILSTTHDIFILTDPSGKILNVNKRLLFISGHKEVELIYKPIDILFSDIKTKDIIFRKTIDDGALINYETKFKTISGEEINVIIDSSCVKNKNGEIIGIVINAENITKRKKVEESLKRSEEILKNTYKEFPLPTYTWKKDNDDFVLVDFNDASAKITNEGVRNYLGEKLSKMYNNRPEIVEDIWKCFEKKISFNKEMHYYFKTTKKYSYLEVIYTYIPQDMVLVFTQDITERKKSEEELNAKQRLNELLLNSLPHPAMLINRKRIVLASNKIALDTVAKIGDYCWKEFAKSEYLSEEDKKRVEKNPHCEGIKCSFCLADEAMKGEMNTKNHPEVIMFDRVWDTFWVPLDEEIFLHYCIDVTERKKAENALRKNKEELEKHRSHLKKLVKERTEELSKANEYLKHEILERRAAENTLKESEKRYRLITENTDDLIAITMFTPNLIYTYVSPSHKKIMGYEPEELTGKSGWEFIHPDDKKNLMPLLLKYLNQNGNMLPTKRTQSISEFIEYRTKDKSGNWHTVESTVNRIEDSLLFISKDVTQRRNEEEKRRKLEEQLYHSQKMESIGMLAGCVAHDFNNILTGIMGYAELLKMEFRDISTPKGEAVDTILKGTEKAAVLIKQLLGFARKGKFNPLPVNINIILKDTIKILEKIFEKNIEIEYEFEEKINTVKADRNQLEQVFTNIFINAKDAMPDGGKLILKTENLNIDKDYITNYPQIKTGDYVKISITDTGIGMTKEVKERIFDPFFTTKEKTKGTGLGLATVYGIVKNHDGYIYCDTEPGKETTFTIYLPASEEKEITEQKEEDKIIEGSETILVVDDEDDVRNMTKSQLETLGYNVLLAKNGTEAVEIYKKNEIDLILLDIIMPKMGGKETYQELKKINLQAKVILISGYSQNGKAKAMLENGCLAFIQKPFKIYLLSRTIYEALKK